MIEVLFVGFLIAPSFFVFGVHLENVEWEGRRCKESECKGKKRGKRPKWRDKDSATLDFTDFIWLFYTYPKKKQITAAINWPEMMWTRQTSKFLSISFVSKYRGLIYDCKQSSIIFESFCVVAVVVLVWFLCLRKAHNTESLVWGREWIENERDMIWD